MMTYYTAQLTCYTHAMFTDFKTKDAKDIVTAE